MLFESPGVGGESWWTGVTRGQGAEQLLASQRPFDTGLWLALQVPAQANTSDRNHGTLPCFDGWQDH